MARSGVGLLQISSALVFLNPFSRVLHPTGQLKLLKIDPVNFIEPKEVLISRANTE